VLVHAQGELGVHGLCVEAPRLAERVVDQSLRDAVVHDHEEADVLQRAPEPGRRGGGGVWARQVRPEIDDRDHADETAPSDGFDKEGTRGVLWSAPAPAAGQR
jgi:hypothetical protein